jgi:glycosyltransferase involved in cell wall biosynthesis
MYRNSSVAVVVPGYNEAETVDRVLETVPDYVDRIYAVDDRSTDETWAEIRAAAERINDRPDGERSLGDADAPVPRVVPIRHEQNRGVGGAIKSGYRRARADGIDVTAVMAGDGQMDPEILDRFLDPIIDGRADYVKGNRLWHRDHWREMSSWRLFGNRLLTILTKVASGYWGISDPQNGYTAISLEALRTVAVEDLYERYGFANDLLVHLNVYGLRVADVHHPAVYGNEESGIQYSTFVPRLSLLLLRGFLARLRLKYLVLDFHPAVLCYAFGTVGTGVGVVSGLRSVLGRRDDGDDGDDDGPVGTLLSLVVLLFGGLFLVLAVWFDIRYNEDLATRVNEARHRESATVEHDGGRAASDPDRSTDGTDPESERPSGGSGDSRGADGGTPDR